MAVFCGGEEDRDNWQKNSIYILLSVIPFFCSGYSAKPMDIVNCIESVIT